MSQPIGPQTAAFACAMLHLSVEINPIPTALGIALFNPPHRYGVDQRSMALLPPPVR